MRYFTVSAMRGSERLWKSRCDAYSRQLAGLLPRLGKRPAAFFAKHSLHDGTLLRCSFGDAVESRKELADLRPARRPSVVLMSVALHSLGVLARYTLRYSGVTSIHVRGAVFPSQAGRSLFGDWMRDELVPAGGQLLRHNILFLTRTEVSIVFRHFSFRREVVTKPCCKRRTRP